MDKRGGVELESRRRAREKRAGEEQKKGEEQEKGAGGEQEKKEEVCVCGGVMVKTEER